MKFLIVGLGFMGKRRIRNLNYLQAGVIIGCDSRLDLRDEVIQRYKIRTFEDFSEAIAQHPDVLIISSPPDLSIDYALDAIKANKHFFMEATLQDEHLAELATLLKAKNIIAAPSCTVCFYHSTKKIKRILAQNTIGDPITFTYHSGQYLLERKHWENDRQNFICEQSSEVGHQGIPFELILLGYLFGKIESISGSQKGLSEKKENNDNLNHLSLKLKDGISGHLLIDMVSKDPVSHLRIEGTKGIIEWDNHEQIVRIYSFDTCLWKIEPLIRGCIENMYINPEEPYIEEMRCFLEAIQGISAFPYTFEDYQAIFDLLHQK